MTHRATEDLREAGVDLGSIFLNPQDKFAVALVAYFVEREPFGVRSEELVLLFSFARQIWSDHVAYQEVPAQIVVPPMEVTHHGS